MGEGLVKTLPFQLEIEDGNPGLLKEACAEAREVYNRTVRLALERVDWKEIHNRIESDLLKNTQQRIVEKSLESIRNFRRTDGYNPPSFRKSSPFPLRMNFSEGYKLSVGENGSIRFRISAKPYKHVSGHLKGDPSHLKIVKLALSNREWSVGIAESLFVNDRPELHVTVNKTTPGEENPDCDVIIGVDINEDNISISASSKSRLLDSLVIEFPQLKARRHEFFTMGKRIQRSGKFSAFRSIRSSELHYVRDLVHKISRAVVTYAAQFENPRIILEDLKDMRDNISYGRVLNRRLHTIPFRLMQSYITYKAEFEDITVAEVSAAYTSQTCPECGHRSPGNRRKRRYKCRSCGFQDHADRVATVNIGNRHLKRNGLVVPALKKLPKIRKLRWRSTGPVDGPAPIHDVPFVDRMEEIVDVLS